jgi:hypothetical protein
MNSPTKDNSEKNVRELMLAYLCIKDIAGLTDRVSILDRFRLSDANIASVCGVAEQSVRNARQKNKLAVRKNKKTERRAKDGK